MAHSVVWAQAWVGDSSCLSLLSAYITDVSLHSQLQSCYLQPRAVNVGPIPDVLEADTVSVSALLSLRERGNFIHFDSFSN